MIRTYLTLAAATVVLLLGYANCGEFKAADQLAKNLSSQCVAKARSVASLPFSASLCDDMSTFHCDRQVFQPGASSESSMKNECVRGADGADLCVVVTTHGFDTSGARDGAAPGAFDVGGEYNHEEVQCSNSSVLKEGVSLIASDASSLDQALPAAISQCRSKGSK